MEAWNDIVRAALVGTERQRFAPPPMPEGIGAVVDAASSASPEDALLATAAALGTWRAAGTRAAPAPRVEPLAATEGEDLPVARASAAYVLKRIVEDAPRALDEALKVLAARGLLAPPELLPALFDAASRSKELRPAVAAVMGKRGTALARMRGDWAFMLGSARGLDASSWDGDRAERAAYLRELRAVEPARARDLVAECWKGEQAAARRDFLATFEVGISADDEPFLESRLDDRSKEVRGVAAELLARLPQSAFVARMAERARSTVRMEVPEKREGGGGLLSRLADKAKAALGAGPAGTAFDIEPPKEADAAAKRDGLDATQPANDAQGRGARGRMLVAIASAAPLDVWTQATGMAPAEIVQRARATDWSGEMDEGWIAAAIAQKNAEWALALHESPGKGRGAQLDCSRVLPLLPTDERERIVIRKIREKPHAAAWMLEQWHGSPSANLTQAVADAVFPRIESTGAVWDHQTAEAIRVLGERGAPELFAEIARKADFHFQNQTSYAKTLNAALHIYQLRHDIVRETAP